MNDNSNYSYISKITTPSNTTHYIKDAEARSAITSLETSKQDVINSSNKLAASNISGLATVATSGSYTDLSNKPSIPTVDTSVSTSSANAVSNKAITAYVDTKISNLGQYMTLKGSAASEAVIKAKTSAKAGDVWINTADSSEWVCTKTITAATASAWEKLGYSTNVDLSAYAKLSDLGFLATKSSLSFDMICSGEISFDNYTPQGTVSVTGISVPNTFTPGSYTPEGTVSVGGVTPTITVDLYCADDGITGNDPFNYANVITLNSTSGLCSVANETLTFNVPEPHKLMSGVGVRRLVASSSKVTPTASFTGKAKAPTLTVTNTTKTPTATFTGTAKKPVAVLVPEATHTTFNASGWTIGYSTYDLDGTSSVNELEGNW